MFGAQIPILQAPIGGSAPPELAAAVANAGAIGGLALTGCGNAEAAAIIAETRALTGGLFFVNLLLAFEVECLDAILDSSAPIVTFSFGDAGRFIAQVKARDKLCGVQVGNLDGAKHAAAQGADFVLCQGFEAGGRVQSSQPLYELLESAVEADLGLPIVAAGGIASGAGIREAMRRGASGVMMGTRFLATRESRAHAVYKERLMAANAEDTAVTVCFMDGWPHAQHRVLRNRTLDQWEAAGCPPPGARPGEGEVMATMPDGTPIPKYFMYQPLESYEGQIEELALYAGTGCGEIFDVPPAAELVERLWREANA